jgi:lipopolysaccharide/colanic/teichoic acid biosynthesis glycosyltransferase
MIKRCLDLSASLAGIIILSPIFMAIAVLIRLFSGPPVFFRQTRVGKDGREFLLIKFRTMMISRGAEKGKYEPGNLSRITSFGRFLRNTKFDELPQLFNVLTGDMSLVGPRPEVKKWVAVYPERWAAIHKVRPGITDPASLIYRKEEELLADSVEPEKIYREEILPQKLSLYEEYLRKRSFLMDFSIIMKTIFSVIKS